MKDENIKEILNDIKTTIDEGHYRATCDIDYEDCKVLYDYITNLQEENRILKENAEHNDHVVDSMRWTVRTLEGRIKKAVEHLEIKQARYRNEEDYKIEDKDLFDIKKILIGDDKE